MSRVLSTAWLVMLAVAPSIAAPPTVEATVPFVGCRTDGQAGPIPAPEDGPRKVSLPDTVARQIASYGGDQSSGVFAPRGWNCRVMVGSSGGSIIVSPAPLDPSKFPQPRIHAPAIELVYLDGGTSGRFSVAAHASRLFPKLAASFIEKVKQEGIEPASDFGLGPYPHDSVTYPEPRVARIVTPANEAGFGTAEDLAPSADVVRSIAVLETTGDWGMAILRIRMSPSMHDVEDAVEKLDEPCVRNPDGC